MSKGKIAVTAGGFAIAVIGGSTTAVSAATVIAATGGAGAVVLAGLGAYKYLSSRK